NRGLETAVDGNAGVRHEQVDAFEPLDRGRDQIGDVLFAADIGHDRQSTKSRRMTVARLFVDVRQDDVRAFLDEPCAQFESDAAGAASHDTNLVSHVHRSSFLSSERGPRSPDWDASQRVASASSRAGALTIGSAIASSRPSRAWITSAR